MKNKMLIGIGSAIALVLTVVCLSMSQRQVRARPSPSVPALDLPDYKVQRPPEGAVITGKAHLSHKKEGVYAVLLRPLGNYDNEWCFVESDSKTGAAVHQILEDGQEHEVMLTIKPLRYDADAKWVSDSGSRILAIRRSSK